MSTRVKFRFYLSIYVTEQGTGACGFMLSSLSLLDGMIYASMPVRLLASMCVYDTATQNRNEAHD